MKNLYLCLFLPLVFGFANGVSIPQEEVQAIVQANNRFALELYRFYSQKYSGENILFSPLSLSSAFAMLQEGAKGKTAEEISDVFHFPADRETQRKGFQEVYSSLNKPDRESKLSIANALWAQKSFPILSDYLETIREYYGGEATNLDFRADPESSRRTINKWVEDRTNNKIKDLLPRGAINTTTRLVLTNAIYFKGFWLFPFDKNLTKEDDFKVGPDKKVKVKMMAHSKALSFPYAESDDFQMLELPYEGRDISMILLLPKNISLEQLEKRLNYENLNKWMGMLGIKEVKVYLPRFKLERKYSMVEDFKKLGMPSVFDAGKADFSGITGKRDLYVTGVVHKAYVDVNEEGTEAAAATGIVLGKTAIATTYIFRADHPFIFFILEKTTGSILFIGRVYNPSGS
ncbi:serpin family protein [bacterium]|nr:serpin family protein [bacterium]